MFKILGRHYVTSVAGKGRHGDPFGDIVRFGPLRSAAVVTPWECQRCQPRLFRMSDGLTSRELTSESSADAANLYQYVIEQGICRAERPQGVSSLELVA